MWPEVWQGVNRHLTLMELNCEKGQNTVWQDNVVETQGVFLYNWHVQIIEAPSFSPFCVTFAKINSVPRYIDQVKKFDSCCFVGTLSSWALVTLSVRPPIRSSPPYTFSPGTSFSRASFPRAWSLMMKMRLVHYCFTWILRLCSVIWESWLPNGLTSDGVWWEQPSETSPLSSLFLAAAKKTTTNVFRFAADTSGKLIILNKWIIRKLLFKKTFLPASKLWRLAACLCDIKVNILRF